MKKEIYIDTDRCKKCSTCTEICPNVIFLARDGMVSINQERTILCIMCGQCMAACPDKAIHVSGLDYEKDFFELPDTINSFNALIQTRRSVRAFKDTPVPEELLVQIVEAISYAPPSFPPIKTEATVVKDKQLIRKALPLMTALYDSMMTALKNPFSRQIIRMNAGKEKFRLLQNHIVPILSIKLPSMKAGTEDAITRNAQAMILLHADRKAENHTTDIFIALSFALLKAHTLGLGATCVDLIPPAINRDPVLREMFKIPDRNEVVASIILGYPKFRYRRAIKRQLKNITWL